MLWVKVTRLFNPKLLLVLLFTAGFFLSRVPGLATDVINPDGVNWHRRSEQFIVGLKNQDFTKTYQYYHPGVILMWVAGVPVELYKQVTHMQFYDQYNFETFDFVAKLSLVLVQFVLTLGVLYVLSRLVTFNVAFATVCMFTFEPFFTGNSRLYHLDILVTLFIFLGLLIAFDHMRSLGWLKGLFAGLMFSLAFLTKSVGIGAPLFVLGYSLLYFMSAKKPANWLRYFPPILLSLVLATFLLFPALWVNPLFYLGEIFDEAERVGIREGHSQIFLGKLSLDAGLFFYPVALLMKVTPILILGIILFLVLKIRSKKIQLFSVLNDPVFYLAVFYFGYMVLMTIASKKIDRYLLPLYPFLSLVSVLGLKEMLAVYTSYGIKKQYTYFVSTVMVFALYVLPLIYLWPYYFTYTSPLFGTPQDANRVLAQKPFGVGVHKLKDFMYQNYGYYPVVGMLDTKPLSQIYARSNIYDARITSPRKYDFLVLGVNESIPAILIKNGYTFRQDSAVVINGLEYWRIYVEENR